jgi:GTP cyclohydrolase II
MIIKLATDQLETIFGTFTEHLYYDGKMESIALVIGEVKNKSEVLCRIHSHCISAHIFNSIQCDCREQMEMVHIPLHNGH